MLVRHPSRGGVTPVVWPGSRGPVEWTLGAPTDLCPCVPAGCYVTVPESACPREMEVSFDVYAIVRAGGRQEKVAVGDVLLIDKVADGEAGAKLTLPALLLVDGTTVTTDAAKLAKVTVSAEVVKPAKGPKITILKHKNKTGYRKRQGHRQPLTQVKITGIKA